MVLLRIRLNMADVRWAYDKKKSGPNHSGESGQVVVPSQRREADCTQSSDAIATLSLKTMKLDVNKNLTEIV